MLVGFCEVDVAGVAPGNDQLQEVGELVLRSVKFTQPAWHITCGVPEKFASGTLQLLTVTTATAVAEQPESVPVTVYDVVAAGDAVTLAPDVGVTPVAHVS